MIERTMPHSLEAEQAVLGSMFINKYALQKAVEGLTVDLFYLDKHGKIFTVLLELDEKKIEIDIATVTEELKNKEWLSQVGDVDYLAEVVNAVPSAANVDEYIRIVNEKAVLRNLIKETSAIASESYNPKENINEILDKAEQRILNVVKNRKASEFRTIQEVLSKTQDDLEKLAKNKGEITGLASGFYDIDRITTGFHENELIIVAARPAMGKTAFALNVATNIAINSEKTVAIFNMEMGAEQLAMRMLSSVGQIEGNRLRNGRLENKDWKKVNEAISILADTKLFVDDTPGMNISEIRAKCRRLASSEDGLGIVIIDYLQLISGTAKYAGNRQQEVSEISRSLKMLAMELNIPVIALAQLSRSVEAREDKRPMLSDLRESGSIEQDADLVAFLYRDSYYNKDKENEIADNVCKSEFIIGKHRNGPTGKVELIFKDNMSTFLNYIDKEE